MEAHPLLKELQAKHDFPEAYFQGLLNLFEEHHYEKGEVIFKAGDIVKYTFFILKGCFRQFYINEEGRRTGEMSSFMNGTLPI
ncbi:MAG: Crp/Fnr family transcriptional regulator [Bacteroidia bacterium]